jgi:hypothetical protein
VLLHTIISGSCLNREDVHPHVEDDTAPNSFELLWLLEMMLRIDTSATQHRRLLNIVGYSTSSATQHRR